ncbi:MAG TPA: DUF711 family protein [Streptosporangiaceae bacterium]
METNRPPVRAVTFGVAQPHPLSCHVLETVASAARHAEFAYRDAGYQVQSCRVSTRPVFEDLADWPNAKVVAYLKELDRILTDLGLAAVSLGMANACDPDFPLDRLALIEELLAASEAVNCAVQVASTAHGLRPDAAVAAARIMQRLAGLNADGTVNFRFAVLACVEPGVPFFPASYHRGPASLSVGLQGASMVARTGEATVLEPASIVREVRGALIQAAAPIARLADSIAGELGFRFGGIDLSPAPGGDDSIVAAMESYAAGPFGSVGTLAVAAAITEALRTTGLLTCGYNGLMLPVLEDPVLARLWAQGRVGPQHLLSYSAVCGTGLDTLPLPGDTPAEMIAALLLDVATLAVRLGKPLSARLIPVIGKRAGEAVTFDLPYLLDTVLSAL